jgi:hypothetical protein
MSELEQARAMRDEAFSRFVEESAKATKHSLKAKAARASYMLASAEVRALERDLLAYEPIIQTRYGDKN